MYTTKSNAEKMSERFTKFDFVEKTLSKSEDGCRKSTLESMIHAEEKKN